MPTYDYECENCGHEFEYFQSITSDPLKKCPECGKNKLRRLIGTGGGVIFKGSGFYETDYRSDSYKRAAAADKSSGGSSGSSKTKSTSKATKSKKTAKESKPATASKSSDTRKAS